MVPVPPVVNAGKAAVMELTPVEPDSVKSASMKSASVEPASVKSTAVEPASVKSTAVETPSAAVPSAPVRCVGEIWLAEDSRAQQSGCNACHTAFARPGTALK
jgi:hypothetical protein